VTVLRGVIAAFCLTAAVASPAAAMDLEEAERRVDASLLMPHRLLPPTYLQTVVVDRPLPLLLRGRDPTEPPIGETGAWRSVAPVKVDVLAVVIAFDEGAHLLALDNFRYPRVARGRINPFPILLALGIR
jgi:hypothetical protein